MNTKNVLDKIKIALGCDTYIDIANALDVTAGAVDNWKKRNGIAIKLNSIDRLCRKTSEVNTSTIKSQYINVVRRLIS